MLIFYKLLSESLLCAGMLSDYNNQPPPRPSRTTKGTGPMLFGFVQIKGGVGKTLLCCHAALWLHDRGLRVVVLDTDTQQAAVRWLAEAESALPVRSVLDARALDTQAPALARHYDLVLIDGAAGLSEALVTTLRVADRVLIPLTPSMPDLLAARQTVQLVREVQPQRATPLTAWVVLNRAQKGRRLTEEAGEAIVRLGLPVAQQAVFLRAAFQDAFGSAVWRDGAEAAAAASEIDHLFEGIFADVLP